VAAGAVWGAVKVGPPERAAKWGRTGLEVLSKLAAEPGTGVRMAAGREVSRAPFEPYYWMRMLADLRACEPSELPGGFTDGWRYSAPLVTMPVHLEYLRARFERAGGTLEVSPVTSLTGLAGAAPVIVNCSGAAAHDLVPDPAVVPVRGQVVIAANPGIDEFLVNRDPEPPWIVYMFPHGDTILLGGTNDEGNWDTEPSPEAAERIMAGCVAIEPRLRGAEILGHRVGLRPCRPEVRLESEPLGDGVLWHNYGHGGAGISMSWGCAAEITRAVQSLRGAGVRAHAAVAAAGVAVAGVVALAACGTPVSAATTAAWGPVAGARITCHSAVQRDDLDAAVLDVAADGPADAWAVGVCGADGGTHDFVGQVPTGFVEHWDGRRWSRVAVPASGEYDVVQAASRQDVWVASLAGDPWAAGQSGSPAAMPGGANVIHWNGRSWAVAQRGLARSASVYALAAAAGNAWALGYLHGATTVLHWTGAAWRPVAGPAGFRFATTPQPPTQSAAASWPATAPGSGSAGRTTRPGR
jgi:D-amino-acid oxidase